MSDDQAMVQWLAKHGVSSIAEAQGAPVAATSRYISRKEGSDLEFLSAEVQGDKVRLFDHMGWCSEFNKSDLDEFIAEHGKLETWKHFSDLGALPSKAIE